MILESIVTTVSPSGVANIAPMGPVVDGSDFDTVWLRPFESSTTCANLVATRRAVIHVTDDVELFAASAVGKVEPEGRLCPVEGFPEFRRLVDCHRYFAVEVTTIGQARPRREMSCRVVASGVVRPFFGFNRAKHAIIEAAILATRTDLLPPADVRRQVAALESPVAKTASDSDAACFRRLVAVIENRLSES